MLTHDEIQALIQLLSRTPLSFAEKLFLDLIITRLQVSVVGTPEDLPHQPYPQSGNPRAE